MSKRATPTGGFERKQKSVAFQKVIAAPKDDKAITLTTAAKDKTPRLQIELDEITALKNTALHDSAAFPIQVKELMNKLGPIQMFSIDLPTKQPIFAAILQALSAIYVHHIKQKNITPHPDDISSMDQQVKMIEQKKTQQFHNYLTYISSILMLNINNDNVKKNQGIDAHLDEIQQRLVVTFKDLIAAVGVAHYKTLTQISQYNVALVFLLSVFAIQHLRPEKVTALYQTHLTPYDDLRFVLYNLILATLPLLSQAPPSADAAKAKAELNWLFNTSHFAVNNYKKENNNNFIKPAIYRSNILHLLSNAKFALVTGQRCIKNINLAASSEEMSKKQKELLSTTWTTLFQQINLMPNDNNNNNEKKTVTTMNIYRYDDISIYSRIFAVMDTHILPNIAKPLILADFLTTSFKIGGLIAIQALAGLFILMTQHKFEYPQFFSQLYHICNLDMLYSVYNIKFFKLLALVLNGPYIPLYITLSFAKKLSRLSLYGPTGANVYITALIFNIMRKHPMMAYLLNRKARVTAGLAKNTTMNVDEINALYRPEVVEKQNAEKAATLAQQKEAQDAKDAEKKAAAEKLAAEQAAAAMNDDSSDEEEQALGPNLFAMIQQASKKGVNATTGNKNTKQDKFLNTLTKAKATELVKKTDAVLAAAAKAGTTAKSQEMLENEDLQLVQNITDVWLNGLDPFVFDILDDKTFILPEQTNAQQSSLIEMKDINKHFYHHVQTNSKLLFADNAPKHAQDITHLLNHLSYATIIEQALDYRSKHLIPTSFQKPISLLGKSERVITADEQYDEELREVGKKLDEERNSIEAIFMW